MDMETLIILAMLAGLVIVPMIFLRIFIGPIKISNSGPRPEDIHKAEVLEEMFKLPGLFQKYLHSENMKHLSDAEINILRWKINPVRQVAYQHFKVAAYIKKNDLKQWIKDPRINQPYPPDREAMLKASESYMPIPMAEKMMKRLLKRNFSVYYKVAEHQLEERYKYLRCLMEIHLNPKG